MQNVLFFTPPNPAYDVTARVCVCYPELMASIITSLRALALFAQLRTEFDQISKRLYSLLDEFAVRSW